MAIQGYGGAVKLGASGGTNAIGSLKTWELPLQNKMADVSVMGLAFEQYVPTLTGAKAKADVILDPNDANGQMTIQSAILNGTLLTVNFYDTASHYYSASAYIAAWTLKGDVKGVFEGSVEFQLTGTISYT